MPTLGLGQVTLNPSGGTSATNGIRLTVGNTGQIQVVRNGTGQLYSPTQTAGATTQSAMDNGVFIAVGTTVVGPRNFATVASAGVTLQEWTPISNTVTVQGNGGTATTVLRGTVGGRNYDLTITWQYVYPNDFVLVTHSLVVPAGNTATVRLYHVMDAYLGGNDFGPSFFSMGPPTIVGGYRVAANIVEAWRYRSGTNWTGYFAGYYACLFNGASCPAGQINSVNAAGTFTNYVEPSVDIDNSFGIMWNYGAAPGTYVTQNDLTFYSFQPQLSARFGTTVITVPAATTLTFTIDNVPGALPQSLMNFTDTLPAGLVLANATVTNTCGGTVTNAAGTAIAAGNNSIRLTGGSMAMGTSRCTIVVNVTSSTAGAYVNGAANISNSAVVANQVTDQTLSVVQGAPIVRLNQPGTINATNASAYPVSGTCQDSNGVVTVRVGTVTVTASCSSNVFSTNVSVAALADGTSISVSASQTNPAGTGSDSATTQKDTIAPGVPTFTAPGAGATVNTGAPTISGTGEPGSTVHVFSGSTEVCTAVVSGNGSWSCVSATLPDGTYTLTGRATDPAGNSGTTSPGRSITIDTTAPLAPSITNPAAGSTVAPNPSVSGTAEAGATVVVLEGTTQLCTTTADAGGQWSCGTTLGIGSHTLVARQTDGAGNVGPVSAGRTFSIANVPTVTLDTPGPINQSNATAVVVAGNCTTTAGTVTVTVGGVTSQTTCAGGRFSTTVNASSLTDGPQIVLTASQTNGTGTGSDTRTTVKDTIVPATPTIVLPAEMSFINTVTPTITGTGEPGSTIRVTRGAVELCSTIVPISGAWACTSSVLIPGIIAVTARARDAADNPSGVSPVRTFTIDIEAPPPPIISMPTQSASVAPSPTLAGTAEPFATVTVFEGNALVCSVTADATGAWSCSTVLGSGPHVVIARQTDRAGNTSVDSGSRSFEVQGLPNVLLNTPSDISGLNAPAYVVTGACTSNAGAVTVSVGQSTQMVACTSNGTFSATFDVRALNDAASITVRASQTTAAGTGSDTRTVRKDATAPQNVTITAPADNSVSTNNQPNIVGTSEAGSTVTVYLAVGSASFLVSGATVANAQGAWTFTPPTPLADSTYRAEASAKDAFNNESARSNTVRFTIDSIAPGAPTIITPVTGTLIDDDRKFTLTGTSEPGSIVSIYVDGQKVDEVTADSNGNFSYEIDPSKLGDADHTFQADARDAAGNQSPKSNLVTVTVRPVDARFAGQGLIGCSTGVEVWALGAVVLLLKRRRSVKAEA